MKPLHRSLLGALVAVASIPVFLGLQACIPAFPVPVGDPEKSRIDPAISGVWISEDDGALYLFEPYDKRSWLLSGFELTDVEREQCGDEDSLESADDAEEGSFYDAFFRAVSARGTDCIGLEGGLWIKAWRTRLGGEWFMTWEPVGFYDEELGFERKMYMVWRIDLSVPGELRLWMFDEGHEAWDALPDDEEALSRRMLERVIRKNASDPGLYADGPMIYYRVRPEHLELIGEIFSDTEYNPW